MRGTPHDQDKAVLKEVTRYKGLGSVGTPSPCYAQPPAHPRRAPRPSWRSRSGPTLYRLFVGDFFVEGFVRNCVGETVYFSDTNFLSLFLWEEEVVSVHAIAPPQEVF
eukprot:TRINITY_DN3802_c0_g1_i1.p2 TRINITY_DN3802_c0_g1~~TRINITY_DN3802_c0_g1_i1.p2  ORF type:complete len:108 (+),score=20.51 TRINITY_DN3802_c0_g1_i1:116-439(+)